MNFVVNSMDMLFPGYTSRPLKVPSSYYCRRLVYNIREVLNINNITCVVVDIPTVVSSSDDNMIDSCLNSNICAEEKYFATNFNYQGRRLSEYYAGRIALKTGLRYLKYPGVVDTFPILTDEHGAPTMPTCTLGSVSHKKLIVVGGVTMGDSGHIGVDIELLKEEQSKIPTKRELSSRVLTDSEILSLGRASGTNIIYFYHLFE